VSHALQRGTDRLTLRIENGRFHRDIDARLHKPIVRSAAKIQKTAGVERGWLFGNYSASHSITGIAGGIRLAVVRLRMNH
jgi:hypothetical protein